MSDNYEVTASGETCTSWACCIQDAFFQNCSVGRMTMANGGGQHHEKVGTSKKEKKEPTQKKGTKKPKGGQK